MSRGCNVNAQGLSQADGAKLVVKNSFLELTDVGSGLSRTRSDSQIGCSTTGGCPARVDAAQDAHRDAGQSSASVQGGPGRTVSEDSVATGSHCSWAEVSNCSGYKIGGCSGIGDNSDDERGGIPGSASGDLHDAGRGPGRAEDCEAAPHSEAQWRPSGKERQHAAGTCKPCLYFGTKRGCSNGVQCGFCHLPHAIKRRPRPSKAVREQCRKRLEISVGGGGRGLGVRRPRGGVRTLPPPPIDLREPIVGEAGTSDVATQEGLAQRSEALQYMHAIMRARARQRSSGQAVPESRTQAA
ncbi:unnamed protein product [Prorocentrum cordatum]|uniref:C3H1-type domain-containing protein n=1 Tax=Prorocentrum cordatum TaxID=2364126 RepID=A0ABN9TJM3_9DINO|nr:unnamed protein product [Polarella glacialis]